MLKDPDLHWESGVYPYDALKEAAITPASSMRAVQDASYAMIEQGAWTAENRKAWDELRIVSQRLWVDFFLYPLTVDDILDALERLKHHVDAGSHETTNAPDTPDEDAAHLILKQITFDR